jgi:hypothetical protein
MQGLQNWDDFELCAHELTQINNKNIWMDKFDNVEEIISSNPITNYIRIKHYDIGCNFRIKLQCFFINYSMYKKKKKKDELIPNAKFYS